MNRRTIAAIAVATASLTGLLVAQQPPDAGKPAFDVVSIKPHNPDDHTGGWANRNGRQTIINNTGLVLIMSAYGVHDYEVIGAPEWLKHDAIDVITTTSLTAATGPQYQAMMQGMLEDRFALKAHRETQDGDKYRIVLARKDGKTGAQLQIDDAPCDAPGRTSPCGMKASGSKVEFVARDFPYFLTWLESAVRRRIEDGTGLTGKYDITLEWARGPNDTEHPSIYTALQEQLGLKLEPIRGPLNVVVIDHIDHPTPD